MVHFIPSLISRTLWMIALGSHSSFSKRRRSLLCLARNLAPIVKAIFVVVMLLLYQKLKQLWIEWKSLSRNIKSNYFLACFQKFSKINFCVSLVSLFLIKIASNSLSKGMIPTLSPATKVTEGNFLISSRNFIEVTFFI